MRGSAALLALALGACGQSLPLDVAQHSTGTAPGLPAVTSGQRPGPALLYAPPVALPVFDNAAPFAAEPLRISGAWALRKGEYLYQDYLYDDHGAAGLPDPANPMATGDYLFAPTTGTLSYPDDPRYANNAADLVELRLKPLADATLLRVTLNTLQDAALPAFTVAVGESVTLQDWPHGAGVRSPAQFFLTVHGDQGEWRKAASGEVLAPAPQVTVDTHRQQITVRIPHAIWVPTGKLRLTAGTGLWDAAQGRYLAPQPSRSASVPGGASPGGAALFNLAFRFHEPTPDWTLLGASLTLADTIATAKLDGSWWRERAQALALASGDVSSFFAEVDFDALRAGRDDDSGLPQTGAITRILASRHAPAPGVDYARQCGRFPSVCDGALSGALQPYVVFVPERPAPPDGWGLTLLLHAWSSNHNLHLGSRLQAQLAARDSGHLVVTPSGRGSDGDYTDLPEADVFETWADVARHYPLDKQQTVLAGFSMGGGGSFRLLSRWPDLFAAAFGFGAVPNGEQGNWIESFRHAPVMVWIGLADEGTPVAVRDAARQGLAAAGLRHAFLDFPGSDHLTLFTNDEWTPAVAYLDGRRVVRDPPRITHTVDTRWDAAHHGLLADHVYWLSGLRVRDPLADPTATLDARSVGRGEGDPEPLPASTTPGVLTGGAHGPMPYLAQQLEWGPAAAMPAENRLQLTARNLASVVVDAPRAGLDCATAVLEIDSDGPLEVLLAPCGRRITHGGNPGPA